MLQCVAMCCSVLQCRVGRFGMLQYVAVCTMCCSVLNLGVEVKYRVCVAVLQCVAVCCSVLQTIAACYCVVLCGAMWCSVLCLGVGVEVCECVAVLQCIIFC